MPEDDDDRIPLAAVHDHTGGHMSPDVLDEAHTAISRICEVFNGIKNPSLRYSVALSAAQTYIMNQPEDKLLMTVQFVSNLTDTILRRLSESGELTRGVPPDRKPS